MIRRCIDRLVFMAPILLVTALPAAAETEGDLAVLRMFYTEKELTVISATRTPRPVAETAENISVVTAEEIRAMNAHSLGEVLARVPGIFVSDKGGFGSTALVTRPWGSTRA